MRVLPSFLCVCYPASYVQSSTGTAYGAPHVLPGQTHLHVASTGPALSAYARATRSPVLTYRGWRCPPTRVLREDWS
eukprot:1130741-Rhodomonas_salina.1